MDATPDARLSPGTARAGAAPRWVMWGLLLGLAVLAVALGQHPRRGVDFRVYLLAAERFLSGMDLYPVSDGTMPFKYAPVAAPFFLPFALLPARLAVALWNLGSVAALAWVVRLTSRASPEAPQAAPWAPVLATVALLPALNLEFFYGQVDAVMLLLLVLAAVGAERGRTWGPAVAFTVAVLLKPPAGLLALLLLSRRHHRVLLASLPVGLALCVPLLARYGIAGSLEQLHAWGDTLARTTPPWALGSNPQGLPTLLLSLLLPAGSVPPPGALSAAQAVAILAFLTLVLVCRPGPRDLLALCCLGVTLLSPLAWRANFVVAWPLLRVAAEERDRLGLSLVLAVGLTGMLVSDVVLGADLARRVLLLRVPALVYTVLLFGMAWRARQRALASLPHAPRLEA
ncbi:glycosyltransferase family 87 protein [Myxococcaceae bacterium GXIMD 01537]